MQRRFLPVLPLSVLTLFPDCFFMTMLCVQVANCILVYSNHILHKHLRIMNVHNVDVFAIIWKAASAGSNRCTQEFRLRLDPIFSASNAIIRENLVHFKHSIFAASMFPLPNGFVRQKMIWPIDYTLEFYFVYHIERFSIESEFGNSQFFTPLHKSSSIRLRNVRVEIRFCFDTLKNSLYCLLQLI